MEFNYSCKTDIGKVRKINEDWVTATVINDVMFLIIADGFGIKDDSLGMPAGKMVAEEVQNFIGDFTVYNSKEFLMYLLSQSIFFANKIVMAYKKSNEVYKDYGCSLTIAAINKNYEMVMDHIGINRLYMIRDNQIYIGTDDHNKAYAKLKNGEITKDEYEVDSDRNIIINGLGYKENVQSFKKIVTLKPNDFILLVTDGVYRMLGDERMKNLIYEAGELEKANQWLIDGANLEGGFDNLSSIVSYIQ